MDSDNYIRIKIVLIVRCLTFHLFLWSNLLFYLDEMPVYHRLPPTPTNHHPSLQTYHLWMPAIIQHSVETHFYSLPESTIVRALPDCAIPKKVH